MTAKELRKVAKEVLRWEPNCFCPAKELDAICDYILATVRGGGVSHA